MVRSLDECIGIEQAGYSFFKLDPMLRLVRKCLVRIPFDFHAYSVCIISAELASGLLERLRLPANSTLW
jgi:hypothetical protein